jgi:hypothetical protein
VRFPSCQTSFATCGDSHPVFPLRLTPCSFALAGVGDLDGLEWRVELTIPARYPVDAPTFRVLGKPGVPLQQHPNVDPATGIMCNFYPIEISQWTPAYSIGTVFRSFQAYFASPAEEEPLNPAARRLLREDRAQWVAQMKSSGAPRGALLAECARHDALVRVEALRGAAVAGALTTACGELRPLLETHAQALADAGLLAALLDALGDPRATDPRDCQAVASTVSAMLRCGDVFKGAAREGCCGGAAAADGGGGGAGAAAAAAGAPCLPAAMLRVLGAHRTDAGARGAACEALAELAFMKASRAHYGELSGEALPVLMGALHGTIEPPLNMECPEVEMASSALGNVMNLDPAAALVGARMLCSALEEACGQGRWRLCSTVLHHMDVVAIRTLHPLEGGTAGEAAAEVVTAIVTGYVRPMLRLLADVVSGVPDGNAPADGVGDFALPEHKREWWAHRLTATLARLLLGDDAPNAERVAICVACGAEGLLRAALEGLPAIGPERWQLQAAQNRWQARANLRRVLASLPLEGAPLPPQEPFPLAPPLRFVMLAPPAPEEVLLRLGSCQECWLRVPREPCPRTPQHNSPEEHLCFICYAGPGEEDVEEPQGPFTFLPCGHLLHASCLFNWAVVTTRHARRGVGEGGGDLNCYCGAPLPLRQIQPDEAPAEGEMVVQTPAQAP